MLEVFQAIESSAIEIAKLISTSGDFAYSDGKNSSGDQQLKLDVESDKIIEKFFSEIEIIKAIASEERDEITFFANRENGKYLIAYDPLDGSSLVDVNLSIGSIFGIYENEFIGKNLIASVYIVYGPRVEMVIADTTSRLYRLINGEFKFIRELKLANKGKINATGGTQKEWSENHRELINKLFNDGYRLRYSGGMVPDLHQILLKGGGLFSYPTTKDQPKGKLRLLFELMPFALVFKMAGGDGIDKNAVSILDLPIENIHDTSSAFFGSNGELNLVREYYK